MIVRSTLIKFSLGAVALLLGVVGWRSLLHSVPVTTPVPMPGSPVPTGIIRFSANAPQLSSLKIDVVAAAILPLSEPLNGRITYDENFTTRVTSPVLGRVLELRAEIGDTVRRGAVLADIDSPDLATAEADWRKAESDGYRKQLAQQRARTLFDAGVFARKDLETADADVQQARAETQRASLRMKNLNAGNRQDGRFSLKAPLDGVVAERQINPGIEVRPELPNPLFVITDLTRLWVLVDVPERSAGALRQGQTAMLEADAYPGQLFNAVIARIGLTVDPLTRRMQVRCSVRNPDRKLKPEMFVRVAFLPADNAEKAFVLPNTSLVTEGMYSYVYVETQPAAFERRRVNLRIRGRDRSWVDTGITSGERVVTEGAFLLNAEVATDVR